MRTRLIGIDLDGTLLDSRGKLPKENLEAVERAREAGVMVVPCTGRSWPESRKALAGLSEGLGVYVNGAIVVDGVAERTVYAAALEPGLAGELVEVMHGADEAVLVFRDRGAVGHDYLVTGRGDLTANTAWWFEINGLLVHEDRSESGGELGHALRVGLVGTAERVAVIESCLSPRFDGRVLWHSFGAVQMPKTAADPIERMHLLEVFAPGVDKWSGLKWVAAAHGIAEEEVAVMGDQINDASLFDRGHAATKIAMGNAVESILANADYVTEANDEMGVAKAIGRLMGGEW